MKISLDALKAISVSNDVLAKITGGNKVYCHWPEGSPGYEVKPKNNGSSN